jgi:murein DD-endopeptidase MepM/ murein hydrolase activator NlpD
MRGRLLAGSAVLVAAAVFALTGRWPWPRMEERPLAVALERAAPEEPPLVETRDTLRRGETIRSVLARHGLGEREAISLGGLVDLRRLPAGLVFLVRRPVGMDAPTEISLRPDHERRVVLRRVGGGWSAVAQPIEWRPEVVRAEGFIGSSLYEALDASIPDAQLTGPERQRLAWDLADVFAWQVDFTRDIQGGERFRVVLERLVSDEGEVRFGRLLAADLGMGGRTLTAFRFATGAEAGFYDIDGNSLRRAFLRTPVEFRRISSGFNRARLHPVLGIMRRHEGADYAANPGTPVLAAADGEVVRAGWAGGYGNLVELRHRNGVTTRYGHLKRFGSLVKPGARVLQGQVIGFVGSTGLSTGPHLHYEFRVNGQSRDPQSIKSEGGAPIPAPYRAQFLVERDRLQALLDGTAPATAAPAPLASAAPAPATLN